MLFGHQNDEVNQAGTPAPLGAPPTPPAAPAPGINPLDVDATTGAPLPVAPPQPSAADDSQPSVLDQPASGVSSPFAPTSPSLDAAPEAPAPDNTVEPTVPADSVVSPDTTDTSTPAADSNLLDLKQQALSQLSPLVGHLDQSPEEKFRTTMMMIQSTDNQSLLQAAYEAANAIPDEKARAQALLDVVNEINYFTQQKQN